MNNKHTLLHTSLCLALGASMMPAVQAAENQGENAERVEVVGSRIKRTDIEGSSPIVVVSRDDIDKSGYESVWQLMEKLTISGTGNFSTLGNNQDSTANGTAGVSLRGLGAEYTLILLNGRRVANSAFPSDIGDTFVDLNSIPVAAIERIEILTDGASAVYGTDAVAGAINIVLRRNFDGVEVNLGHGNTLDSDAAETTASFVGGFGGDKASGTLVFDYFTRNALMNKDRDFAASADNSGRGGADARSSRGSPGSYTLTAPYDLNGNGVINAGETAGSSFADPACPAANRAGANCLYDYGPANTLFPNEERAGAMFFGEVTLGDSLTFFTELQVQHNRTEAFGAPTPFDQTYGYTVPANHPNNPYGQELVLRRYRTVDLGARVWDIETDTTRLLAGLRGDIGSWEWETGFTSSRQRNTQAGVSGWVRRDKFGEALRTGVLNPFGGVPLSQAARDMISTTLMRNAESRLDGLDLKLTGDLFQMGGGMAAMAMGVDYREESGSDIPDRQFQENLIVGTEAIQWAADRDVKAFWAEMVLPFTDRLEAQLAVRHDKYSDFGGSTNPKLALRFNATDNLSLRASWSTGFHAPTLPQLGFGGFTEESPRLVDTQRCNQLKAANVPGAANSEACTGEEISTFIRGNPNLKAEESTAYNVGMIWQINDDLSFNADWWNIEIENQIDKFHQDVLNRNYNNAAVVIRSNIVEPGVTLGPINYMYSSYVNVGGRSMAEGLDVSADWKLGAIKLTAQWSYLNTWEADGIDYAGEYNYPQNRFNIGADWSHDNIGVAAQWNYIGEYDDFVDKDENGLTDVSGAVRSVDAFQTLNAQFRYLMGNSRLTLGIDNLLDEEAPFTIGDGSSTLYGFSNALHNPRGRFAYAKWQYRF